jgi:hypothetical protein
MMKENLTIVTPEVYKPVIPKIILFWTFPSEYQKGWTELEDVISIGVDEVKDIFTVHNDGLF